MNATDSWTRVTLMGLLHVVKSCGHPSHGSCCVHCGTWETYLHNQLCPVKVAERCADLNSSDCCSGFVTQEGRDIHQAIAHEPQNPDTTEAEDNRKYDDALDARYPNPDSAERRIRRPATVEDLKKDLADRTSAEGFGSGRLAGESVEEYQRRRSSNARTEAGER